MRQHLTLNNHLEPVLHARKPTLLQAGLILLAAAVVGATFLRTAVSRINTSHRGGRNYYELCDKANILSASIEKRIHREVPGHDLTLLRKTVQIPAQVSSLTKQETGPALIPPPPRLTGIICCSSSPSIAIFGGLSATLGDYVGSWRITAIGPEHVTLANEATGESRVMILYEKTDEE